MSRRPDPAHRAARLAEAVHDGPAGRLGRPAYPHQDGQSGGRAHAAVQLDTPAPWPPAKIQLGATMPWTPTAVQLGLEPTGRHPRRRGRVPGWVARWAVRWADRINRTRRRRALEAAVPEALDVLRATVASGAAPATGLLAAAETAAGPLADVLQGAVRACALGVPAGRALADAGAAVDVQELVTAGQALDLAAATGAPPGPVLAGVARGAMDRLRARQARLAATAGARLSVRVLAALGPGFVALLALTAPDDVAFLVREPAGWATLALALAFEISGLAWSRRILEDRP